MAFYEFSPENMMRICDNELGLARFLREYQGEYEYLLQNPVGPVEVARSQFIRRNLQYIRATFTPVGAFAYRCPNAAAVAKTMEAWDLSESVGCYDDLGEPLVHAQRLKGAYSEDIATIKLACEVAAQATHKRVQEKFEFTAPVEFDTAGWKRMLNEVVYERQKLQARLANVNAVEHWLNQISDLRRCINTKGAELDVVAKRAKRSE